MDERKLYHIVKEVSCLYDKSKEPNLNMELFKNPPSDYRGMPFWAWNAKLDPKKLNEQIDIFKEMGFGGFHMHVRQGLETEYLSEEFMSAVKSCTQKAKKENIYACLYDEDRWPSGFAGGLVTKNPKFRQRVIYITKNESALPEFETDIDKAVCNGAVYIVGCYDIEFNEVGELKSYKKIEYDENAKFEKYYVYSKTNDLSDKYNFQTYTDIMQPEAIKAFIEITYERYYNTVGDEYGRSIPSIFTDEPRQKPIEQMAESDPNSVAVYYWTYDFDKSFKEKYGYDIVENIPKIIWDTPNNTDLYVRYDYFNHAADLLANAFFRQVSEVAEKQGIAFTGHLMCENELFEQLRWTGDAMRLYPYFTIPGIDMLFDRVELVTAKQAQSIVHQYNKAGMLSELYGVTGWDFDFKCLKMQGDWQAALGVTVRVPHLSMMSMEGRAKRDYPASFQYQVPWYKEYKYIENHFARLNTVLTRGKARVNVAVLHPIETTMLHTGTKEKSSGFLAQQERDFQSLVGWLLYSAIDFDFINESLLPTQEISYGRTLNIGAMKYRTVIIPPIDTVRGTTLEILEKFLAGGGRVIFMGECPAYVDGRKSERSRKLYESSVHIGFSKTDLIELLENDRIVSLKNEDGMDADSLIYQLREDTDFLWLFIARAKRLGKHSCERRRLSAEKIMVTIDGIYNVQIYDTVNGEVRTADYEVQGEKTVVKYDWYANDSLLLKLTKHDVLAFVPEKQKEKTGKKVFKEQVSYRRDEPNVVLFDIGRYSFDGKTYSDNEYVLEMNKIISDKLGLVYSEAQPYVIKDKETVHKVYGKFEFESEIETDNVSLALERAEDCKIYLNGVEVNGRVTGYYTDEAIKTVKLPIINKGVNTIEIEMPFTTTKNIEACYLLGDFDVILDGCAAKIGAPSRKINFGSITKQGMPFYGGNVIYSAESETDDCTAKITVGDFGAHCVRVFIDGEDAGLIALAPFCIEKKLSEGRHSFEFVCYGNRNNTFGPVHNKKMTDSDYYITPASWGKNSEFWQEAYNFQDVGILNSPVIEFYK